jgi:hypothetical protein
VLKRGTIRKETEYHPLMGVANDVSIDISGDERDQLNRLLTRFETAVVGRAE